MRQGEAFVSASRAANTYTHEINNGEGFRGIVVYQDLTVLGASSVVEFKIQFRDPSSGKWIDILSSAATGAGINATGTARLVIFPGVAETANLKANDVLPQNVRISVTVSTAASTFSIGYELLP